MIDNTVAFIGAGNMAQCINTMGHDHVRSHGNKFA